MHFSGLFLGAILRAQTGHVSLSMDREYPLRALSGNGVAVNSHSPR